LDDMGPNAVTAREPGHGDACRPHSPWSPVRCTIRPVLAGFAPNWWSWLELGLTPSDPFPTRW